MDASLMNIPIRMQAQLSPMWTNCGLGRPSWELTSKLHILILYHILGRIYCRLSHQKRSQSNPGQVVRAQVLRAGSRTSGPVAESLGTGDGRGVRCGHAHSGKVDFVRSTHCKKFPTVTQNPFSHKVVLMSNSVFSLHLPQQCSNICSNRWHS